jgi:hypothetical protein
MSGKPPRLPGLAAALVPDRAKDWDEDPNDVPIVPLALLGILPAWAQRWLSIPGEQLYALKATRPMSKKDEPKASWSSLDSPLAEEEPPHDPLWLINNYWLSYQYALTDITVSHTEVATRSGLDHGIFLVGDAAHPNATDVFVRPPVSDLLPGVICHACGVATLLDKPIIRVFPGYLSWFNAFSTGCAVLLTEALGLACFACRKKPLVRTIPYLILLRLGAIALIIGIATHLWNAHVAWTEAVWAIGAILLLLAATVLRRAIAHTPAPPPIAP